MEFLPSSFYVTFQNYRDRSVEFTIKCVFISSEPVNGRFLRHVLTEDKRRFTRALDHYCICYDFTTLLDDLAF